MEWMILPLRRYIDFRGRSRRKEYWLFVLFVVAGSLIFSGLDAVLGLGGAASRYDYSGGGFTVAGAALQGGVLNAIFLAAILIPSIAVTVRRLHDLDKSGLWFLIVLIPLFGWIVAIVWYSTDGMRGANRFGPDPKAPFADPHDPIR